jgi:glycine/D-amino acid oxidase-like deaminating enzyme
MDLRSGHPFWLLKNGLLASYPSLHTNLTCDVAVLGGGITGALVAHYLTKAGVNVALLDKRDVASGSTAASTALLQYAADTELCDLVEKVGQAAAVRSYHLGKEAIDKLEEIVHQLGDDCGFERKQSLYLASLPAHLKKLRREHELRIRHGLAGEFLEEADIETRFDFKAPGAILSPGDAQVDAYRLTHRLLRQSVRQGLRVYDRCEVKDLQTTDEGMTLATENGNTVTARRVVFATGYESRQYLKQNVGTLHSTYAVISEPVEQFPLWTDRCLIWETARPYVYLRTTQDDRILVGGCDTAFASDHAQDRLVERQAKLLVERFDTLFPETEFELAYSWAGTFGSTKDGLAYIGQTPEWPHAYFALGYGGNGITYSLVAAELITDHFLGRSNPDARIFRFDR